MSQEAEYYVRNLSYGEARDLARRIASQERVAAERYAQQLINSECRKVERRLQGEISGLRQEVGRRQDKLQHQLECNERLIGTLNERANVQGEALVEHERALLVLVDHNREIERQLAENRGFLNDLASQQKATEKNLQDEIAARRLERERHASNVVQQRVLATALFDQLPLTRIEAVGLSADLATLRGSLNRALMLAAQASNEQAALAVLLECQNKADGLLIELDRREIEIFSRRESVRLSIDSVQSRIGQLRQDADVASIFGLPIAATESRIAEISSNVAALDRAGSIEFGTKLARWESAVQDCRVIQEDLEKLWSDRDRILDQVKRRNATLKAIITSLMDVWGHDFEVDDMYATTDDPRSTLMIQTKRPHGPNATIHLELDGRMQVSFTGYVGMECAKDMTEFQKKLEKTGGLKMEQGAIRNQPDKPNPPGVGGGSGPIVFQPPTKSDNQTTDHKKR